jgi:anti-sigma-K factor RskA
MAATQPDKFERLFEQMSDESITLEDGIPPDDVLAAELSLGLLTGDELAQATRRALIDQTFAGLVEYWDIQFSTLTDDIAPVAPPKGVFKKIKADAYPESPKRIWKNLGIVPAFLCAGAAALTLLVALQFGGYMQPDAVTPTSVARVVAQDNSLVVAAAYVEDSGQLFVERQVGVSAQGRSLELWVIAGDAAPVSLGILATNETIDEIIIPENLRNQMVGATLAISDEPFGGSLTGAPTGAVLAAGEITTL